MTADHAPERLSAEEREAEALADSIAGCFSNVSDLPEWMQVQALGRYMRPLALLAARAVLASDWHAAHLADVEARLAAVEALAEEREASARWLQENVGVPVAPIVKIADLRAALHPTRAVVRDE